MFICPYSFHLLYFDLTCRSNDCSLLSCIYGGCSTLSASLDRKRLFLEGKKGRSVVFSPITGHSAKLFHSFLPPLQRDLAPLGDAMNFLLLLLGPRTAPLYSWWCLCVCLVCIQLKLNSSTPPPLFSLPQSEIGKFVFFLLNWPLVFDEKDLRKVDRGGARAEGGSNFLLLLQKVHLLASASSLTRGSAMAAAFIISFLSLRLDCFKNH